jgi:hypothetical protein
VGRREQCGALLAGVAVFAIPFAAFTGLVLYQFYVKGSFLLDCGWFAFVMSARDLSLPNPTALGGGSFFGTHITPVFLLTALLRRILALSDPQFFALFIGLCHALPGVGVFWALRSGFGLRGAMATAAAASVALAFAFNGLALAIVRYPHFEILIVGCAILFAVALAQRRLGIAALCLTVALATREDAGFHLFGILAVLIALNRWYGVGWREQRAELAFAGIALAYAAAAVAVQLEVATGPSALVRIYLGSPAFAHLTLAEIAERLLGYTVFRAYVVLPAAIALWWAGRTRNPYILVGYVAVVPWALLQLTAYSQIAGTLSGYYAYPFMIAAFWPLVGVLFERRRRGAGTPAVPILAFSAMIAASFVAIGEQYNPGRFDLARGFLEPPPASRQEATDRAVAALARSKPLLGHVLVDGSVLALMPDAFRWTESVQGRGPARPDAVVYFADGYEAPVARRIAAASDLGRHYRVPGTAIRLDADRAIAATAPLAALLVPADRAD